MWIAILLAIVALLVGIRWSERSESRIRQQQAGRFADQYYEGDSIARTVAETFSECFGVEAASLTPNKRIDSDFGVDEWIEAEQLRLSLEEQLGVQIPNDWISPQCSIGELVEATQDCARGKAGLSKSLTD